MDLAIREGQVAEIARLETSIPEFTRPKTLDQLEQRLQAGRGALILVACDGQRPVAFKAGYALAQDTFYSWVGAVLPGYRRAGIARKLLHGQEDRLRKTGHRRIRVKSRNAFPGMLRLLLGEGYRIVALEPVPSAEDPKVVFEKILLATRHEALR
ncbi:GNAT family N-acetyltransferase [Luteimonas aestuarii]|uniref:GNAT family N-acetyltransferase n=1 Tax=Luteimonas aestuarii TaxID=453837 RepID=A0A4R5TJT3_9GAMM|nr:GNAT family N-acetyltransferase [Luteimonas aestuarii]TDK22318.1 GNAT family N-acetyltransferase [Luteimonas aestuarii]